MSGPTDSAFCGLVPIGPLTGVSPPVNPIKPENFNRKQFEFAVADVSFEMVDGRLQRSDKTFYIDMKEKDINMWDKEQNIYALTHHRYPQYYIRAAPFWYVYENNRIIYSSDADPMSHDIEGPICSYSHDRVEGNCLFCNNYVSTDSADYKNRMAHPNVPGLGYAQRARFAWMQLVLNKDFICFNCLTAANGPYTNNFFEFFKKVNDGNVDKQPYDRPKISIHAKNRAETRGIDTNGSWYIMHKSKLHRDVTLFKPNGRKAFTIFKLPPVYIAGGIHDTSKGRYPFKQPKINTVFPAIFSEIYVPTQWRLVPTVIKVPNSIKEKLTSRVLYESITKNFYDPFRSLIFISSGDFYKTDAHVKLLKDFSGHINVIEADFKDGIVGFRTLIDSGYKPGPTYDWTNPYMISRGIVIKPKNYHCPHCYRVKTEGGMPCLGSTCEFNGLIPHLSKGGESFFGQDAILRSGGYASMHLDQKHIGPVLYCMAPGRCNVNEGVTCTNFAVFEGRQSMKGTMACDFCVSFLDTSLFTKMPLQTIPVYMHLTQKQFEEFTVSFVSDQPILYPIIDSTIAFQADNEWQREGWSKKLYITTCLAMRMGGMPGLKPQKITIDEITVNDSMTPTFTITKDQFDMGMGLDDVYMDGKVFNGSMKYYFLIDTGGYKVRPIMDKPALDYYIRSEDTIIGAFSYVQAFESAYTYNKLSEGITGFFNLIPAPPEITQYNRLLQVVHVDDLVPQRYLSRFEFRRTVMPNDDVNKVSAPLKFALDRDLSMHSVMSVYKLGEVIEYSKINDAKGHISFGSYHVRDLNSVHMSTFYNLICIYRPHFAVAYTNAEGVIQEAREVSMIGFTPKKLPLWTSSFSLAF